MSRARSALIWGTLTRRDLLMLAGAAAGASVLGGCTDDAEIESGMGPRTHLIFLTTKDGVSVVDQDGRVVTPATLVATARPDWSQVVTARPQGEETVVVISDLASGRVASKKTLQGRFEPRIVSPTREQIASVPPGGAGIYGLHQPGGRDRTTIVVSGPGGEHIRADLDGNIEPEAFDPTGNLLFVLDYVPAAKPERFRMRAIDLATGRQTPLTTRTKNPVPIGAEEQIRAHRVQSLYDARRAMHFTLSYEPDTIAFVHCLHSAGRWSHRVDLPAPFGRERPGVHAMALSPAGDRLCVVHAASASFVDIDPDELVVRRRGALARTSQLGKPNVLIGPTGRLIVNVDRKVIATDPYQEIKTPGKARGLALSDRDDIWWGIPAAWCDTTFPPEARSGGSLCPTCSRSSTYALSR